jgi:hypothetical protein
LNLYFFGRRQAGLKPARLFAQTQSVFMLWQSSGGIRCGPIKPRERFGMAFGMPETKLSSDRNAEKAGNLTVWHVACQKLQAGGTYKTRMQQKRP